MESYKVVIDKRLISWYIAFIVTLYILYITDVFRNGIYLIYAILALIIYDLFIFFCIAVTSLVFVNKEYVIVHKYSLFKKKELKINLSELSYKYKKRVTYPNKFYELIFIIQEKEILINSTGGELISFTDVDEKKILNKLEKLNIKKIE